MSEVDICAIVLEYCGSTATISRSWYVEVNDNPSQWSVMVRHARARRRNQGWKLHISAGSATAEAVLRRVLPVLLAEDAEFKVVTSLRHLAQLNDGRAGMSQVGKFITVYPSDDDQAVCLAVALDAATRGLRGPLIPSDRPLYLGSLVHYRYGAFVARHLQTPGGAILAAIEAPNGDLLPDSREFRDYSPDWAIDPFRASRIASDQPPLNPLVKGRYLIVATLNASARGAVARAVDIVTPRQCILKRAARDGQMQLDGRDARDNLRHEVIVLARLAPDPRFPAVFDMFEQDGDLILVMEDVQGESLDRHLAELSGKGCFLPSSQIITWGREIVAVLAAVHAKGFVYRDLKTTHVIVSPNGRLRFVDFDTAYEIGFGTTPHGFGTRGYASPQQHAGVTISIADDIYSMGALLYAMATGADPSQAPDPLALLDRPLRLMNPTLGIALEQVIVCCLAFDKDARFHSISDLDTALTAAGAEISGVPSFSSDLSKESDVNQRQHWRNLAARLGNSLCTAARRAPNGNGLVWEILDHPSGQGVSRDLYDGSGGVVLALAEAVAALNQREYRVAVREGTRWLLTAPRPGGLPVPGLYVGEAGIGAVLLRAGQVLGHEQLIAAALERGRFVATHPHVSPDLLSGTAGRLRFHLLLWDETGDVEQLEAAVAAGEALLEAGESQEDGGLRWVIPEGYEGLSGHAYTGYAHGAAGIADTLLDLFEEIGDSRYLHAAQAAGRWLARLALPSLDDQSGLNWPTIEGEALTHCFWCHGAAGIGQFWLHVAQLGAVPEALSIAERAARSVARGARWPGPSQCHGLAGNIEFLLDMGQFTGQRAYLDEARSLAHLLETFVVDRTPDHDETRKLGYMLGRAGVMACLLRLSDLERRPRQLSRLGFRYKTVT